MLTLLLVNSRQALKKYVLANNNLGNVPDAVFTTQFNRALSKGTDSGVFNRPKGMFSPTIVPTTGAWCDCGDIMRWVIVTGASNPSTACCHQRPMIVAVADLDVALRRLGHCEAR